MHATTQCERGITFLTPSSWAAPPNELLLPGDEVHVWRAELDGPARLSTLSKSLSPSEINSANRFRFLRDRDRFLMVRSVLRLLLGRYLRQDPSTLQFVTNEFGKPALVSEKTARPLRFNLSHSRGIALFAFVRGREVGIDVEQVRPDRFEPAIVHQFFAPDEIAELEALDPRLRVAGFFNCWTRKEAYIKARGLGFSLPLDTFCVSLRPGSAAVLLRDASDPAQTSVWSLRELQPGGGYVGCLAVEGHNWQLKSWQWQTLLNG